MSALAAMVSRDERVLGRGPDALGRLVHQESWASLAAASEALWVGACGPAASLSRADGAAGTRRAVLAGDLLNIVTLRRELGLTPAAAPADVALAAHERWGTALFDRLEGNYVLLLHDAPAGLTLAGVDPRGLGQLQATRLGEDVLLASEAKAFFADPRFKAKLDSTGLADLMVTGWVLDGGALFAGVEGLAVGCHFEIRAGKLASVRHADDRELVRGDLRGESYLDRMAVVIRAIAAGAFAGEELLPPVTGGLDARLILAAAPPGAAPLPSRSERPVTPTCAAAAPAPALTACGTSASSWSRTSCRRTRQRRYGSPRRASMSSTTRPETGCAALPVADISSALQPARPAAGPCVRAR